VLLVDAPLVEWYYPALKAGVTHLSIQLEARPAHVVNSLRQSTPRSLEALRAGALAVGKKYFCPQCTPRFLRKALVRWRKHFGLAAVLDDAARRKAFTRDVARTWDGDYVELAFVPAMDLPRTFRKETVYVIQALLKSLGDSDTALRVRSVAGDRMSPTSKWHLHNWRPGPDDVAFDVDKDLFDVAGLSGGVLKGEAL